MTMLTSLLGTKMLGFLALLWQEAAASPTPAAANEFTITEMVKNMGAVAIVVVIICAGQFSVASNVFAAGAAIRSNAGWPSSARLAKVRAVVVSPRAAAMAAA